MRGVLWTIVLAGLGASTLAAQAVNSSSGMASITERDVAHRVGILADDSMAGRETGSEGLERAVRYITSEFAGVGLEPLGDDGSYVQRYRVLERELDLVASVVTSNLGTSWSLGTELARYTGETPLEGVTAPTVVVSGLFSEAEAIAHVPLEGKIILLIAPMTPEGEFQPANDVMLRLVRARDAAAVIMVTDLSETRWGARLARLRRIGRSLDWTPVAVPVLYVQDETIEPLLAAAGFDLAAARLEEAPRGTPLPELRLHVTVAYRDRNVLSAPNVVGMLRGSDPALADEYVVFSAHMDHLGIRSRPGSDTTARDSIYNGADDNASGTTGVLELAEAFAAAGVRPRRSLLFLLVSGEEQGLWGSDYFATRPPVPLEQMVADINMDMIGRNSPDTIAVIGIDQSDLGTTLHAIADDHAELGMAVVDDPWPQLRLYTRSDHFNFARRGVPVLFFFNGTHEDYHRPGDEPQKINAEKEARILKLIYLLGARVANADQRPQWNKESYEAVVGSSRP